MEPTHLPWTRVRACASLAALALLGACAQTGPAATAPERVVRYACDRGETLEVRYRSQPDVAVLSYHGQRFELPIQPSGSGFAYGDGRHNLRGKGDALTLEVGRMVPLQCTAQP
ncbi:MAG: MliC family protein [Pseudomonadota bacterium]|jgi:membrane-bound inhibitor of C-type lysozyme